MMMIMMMMMMMILKRSNCFNYGNNYKNRNVIYQILAFVIADFTLITSRMSRTLNRNIKS